MYIFDKTTYHKELILKNRKYYRLKARKIGKDTLIILKLNKDKFVKQILTHPYSTYITIG